MEVLEIQTLELILLACPKMAARDLVDDEEQDDGNDEGPKRATVVKVVELKSLESLARNHTAERLISQVYITRVPLYISYGICRRWLSMSMSAT